MDTISPLKKNLISVVVPAYNVELYIKSCIESLKKQDFQLCEFIIVNDGSTDSTLDTILRETNDDERFMIINQRNGGVSAARNRGVAESHGDYILFIDADDYLIEADALSILYRKATKYSADVVAFGSFHQEKGKDGFICSFDEERLVNISDDVIEAANFTIFSRVFRTSVWNKFYRKEVLKTNGIIFTSYNVVMSEDKVFNDNVFCCSNRILLVKDVLYHYSIIDGSLSHSKKYDNVIQRSVNTVNKAIIHIDRFSKSEQKTIFSYVICECLSSLAGLMKRHNRITWKEAVEGCLSFIESLDNRINEFFPDRRFKYERITSKSIKNLYYSILLYGIVSKKKRLSAVIATTYHMFK